MHVTNVKGKVPRNVLEMCQCCNPISDGGLAKPIFNSTGAPYEEAKPPSQYFSRGSGGVLKVGKAKKIWGYRTSAMHPVPEEASVSWAWYKLVC